MVDFSFDVVGVEWVGAGCSGPVLRIQTQSSSGRRPHVELVLDGAALAQLHTALAQYAEAAIRDAQAPRQ